MNRAGALLLMLQAAAYHQASLPTNAELVIKGAAGSLEGVLGLGRDYDALKPMIKDIDIMKERMVELMPYLEEAERPVITTAYASLLDLEGTLTVDFGTTLGLLSKNSEKYSKQMMNKIDQYPGKLKSSLRTLRSFLGQVSTNTEQLVEISDAALRQAKTVLISAVAFRNMMKAAQPKKIAEPQPFKSFLQFNNITQIIKVGVETDHSFDSAISFVQDLIPSILEFGAGFIEIQETPNLRMKVDEIIEKNRKVVEDIRKISTGLRNAKDNIGNSYLAVDDLKKNTGDYDTDNMDKFLLSENFGTVVVEAKKLGKTAAFATGYKPNDFDIPAARTTAPTTTTTTKASTTAGATTKTETKST